MTLYVVDVESDGPIPYKYSMLEFGAILVDPDLKTTFYSYKIFPTGQSFEPRIYDLLKTKREDYVNHGRDPRTVMQEFEQWIRDTTKGRPVFISDNNGYDWQWINYYFHTYLGRNIFGYSSRRISDLFCGFQQDLGAQWKHMRITKHTHHPLDDARGNAEALIEMFKAGLNKNRKRINNKR